MLSRDQIADMRKKLDEEDSLQGWRLAYPLPDQKQLQLYMHSCMHFLLYTVLNRMLIGIHVQVSSA